MSVLWLALFGCIQRVGPGPDVGDCAEPPEGSYTYGEIGIGTCLAGPSDLAFVQTDDGRTLLTVANADPFLTFTGGSVVFVDLANIDLGVGKNTMTAVGATAIDADRFAAGVGYLPDRHLLLVAGKFSPNAATTSARDDVEVFDLTNPDDPEPWESGASITVEDDPVFVRIDAAQERAYVVNVTDHSVSVLDTTGTPIAPIDVVGEAVIQDALEFPVAAPAFGEADGGVRMGVDGATVIDATDVPTDTWTLSWVDGTYRTWTPEFDEDGNSLGLVRRASGGDAFVVTGASRELAPDEVAGIGAISDPFAGDLAGYAAMFFTDSGTLRSILWDPALEDWNPSTLANVLVPPDGSTLGGGSVIELDSGIIALFDIRTGDGDAAIGFAGPEAFTASGPPVLSIPDGSLTQPFMTTDGLTGNLRVWATRTVEGAVDIVTSDSADGQTWADPVAVTGLPADVGAPAVVYANGRYLLFAAHASDVDPGRTALLQAWSYDGYAWNAAHDVLADIGAWNPDRPIRPALQSEVGGGFRVEGLETGLVTGLATPGTPAATPSNTGISFRTTAGEQFDLADEEAEGGVEPGTFATTAQGDVLFATVWDVELLPRIAVIAHDADGTWTTLDADVIPTGTGGNALGAQKPVVFEDDAGFVMFYAARHEDGTWRIHRATSSDGVSWDAETVEAFSSAIGDEDPRGAWDAQEQLPHSVEQLEDGQIRLWYAGLNGSKYRIGAALGTPDALMTEVAPDGDRWLLDAGQPGQFDQGGVKDPLLLTDADGGRQLFYAAYDGTTWAIAHAVERDGTFERRGGDAPFAAMANVPNLFGAAGANAPVLGPDGAIWFAGYDTFEPRVGRAMIATARSFTANGTAGEDLDTVLFPTPRFPTAGDRLVFSTKRGDDAASVIELSQRVDTITASGQGVAGAFLDELRGFLYLPSKVENKLYVVDVRDDTTETFDDSNALDLEAIVTFATQTGPHGFRDAQVVGDRLYVTSQDPDALWVVDLTRVVDDGEKDLITDAALAAMPLATTDEDAGVESFTGTRGQKFGAGDMALSADGRYLWVPEYLANSVVVFDLTLGAYGVEIARIPYIGEAPHQIRLSPDGRLAFVANYLGEVDDVEVSPTIAVIDADPASPTFLSPLTWLGNRP